MFRKVDNLSEMQGAFFHKCLSVVDIVIPVMWCFRNMFLKQGLVCGRGIKEDKKNKSAVIETRL